LSSRADDLAFGEVMKPMNSEAEGSAVSLSLAAEAKEENCRSLGFAPSKINP
jgi:hypothetical protein